MKNVNRLNSLLKELSRDPQLKQAIATARRRLARRHRSQLEKWVDMPLLLSAIASPFLKKKKARAFDERMEIVRFLAQVSLLVKENVFDRPEVREFIGRGARQIQLMTREGLGMILQQRKRPPAVRGSEKASESGRTERPRRESRAIHAHQTSRVRSRNA